MLDIDGRRGLWLTGSHHVEPYCGHQLSVLVNYACGSGRRTFSNPKNLSLPSVRTGSVTSFRCFSRGVGCGALGSFFAGAAFFDSSDSACSPCRQFRSSSILRQVRPYRSSFELAEEGHLVQRTCAARAMVCRPVLGAGALYASLNRLDPPKRCSYRCGLLIEAPAMVQ